MTLSFTALLMSTLFGCIMILLLYFIMIKVQIFEKIPSQYLSFCTLLIILRLILPIEFGHSIAIPSKNLLPILTELLNITVFQYRNTTVSIFYVLIWVWIIGILFNFVIIIYNYFKMRKLVYCLNRTGLDITHTISQKSLFLNLDKFENLKIIRTKYVSTPLLSGIQHPFILLPDVNFTDSELRYIITHEFAHLTNHDILRTIGLELLCSILWWNPVIYLFKNQYKNILELRIDTELFKNYDSIQRVEYLECLLKVFKHQLCKNLLNKFALTFSSKSHTDLWKRMHYLTVKHNKRSSTLLVGAFILITIFSTSIVVESYAIPPLIAEESFTIESGEGYLIKNGDNTYSCYINEKFSGNIYNPNDGVFKTFPKYNTMEEYWQTK